MGPSKTHRKAAVQDHPGWVTFDVLEGDKVIRQFSVPDGPLNWPVSDGR